MTLFKTPVPPSDSKPQHGAVPSNQRDRFRFQVAGTDFVFRSLTTDDPMPTGRDLVRLAGFQPIEEHVVLQILPSGDLEDVRLNETVDLRGTGVEQFIVAGADRTYRLHLVDNQVEWPAALINGLTLKRLGKQSVDSVAVFLVREHQADTEIDDHEYVDLAQPGIERFYFRPIAKLVSILVNKHPVKIEKGERTGLEIKQAAIAQGVPIKPDFVLSLHKEGGQTKIIGDTDRVIDSAEQCADDVARRLDARNLRRPIDATAIAPMPLKCFVTDDPDRFARLGSRFLGVPMETPTLVSPDDLYAKPALFSQVRVAG